MINGTTISAEHHVLIDALHDEEAKLAALIEEMRSFDPTQLTKEEIEKRDNKIKEVKELDPKITEQELDYYRKVDVPALFMGRFYDRLERLSAKIILLSACVIEASINEYIAFKIDEAGDHDLFNDIEKIDIIKKWTLVPRLFNKNYQFDKSGQLYQRLLELKRNRDAFTHYKITMERSGKKVLKGSPHPRPGETMQEEAEILMEYSKLPAALVKHLLDSDDSMFPPLQMLYFQLHRKVSNS
ncbi:MAG: hypothetical protein RQ867_07115 [Mariprofundaceae bacterium]|nr:hypothetical protein [Mariprofundaceae bacterium]